MAGWSVAAAARRFGVAVPAGVTIVHHDLERRVGALAFKAGGGCGGNRGLRSVGASLGTPAFRRLRVGIGRPDSRESAAVAAWVLADMPAVDVAAVDAAWRRSRYRLWQVDGQRDAPGLRPALYRLALASLLQPRLAAASAAEAASLAAEVLGLVGASVERALGFCGVMRGHSGEVRSAQFGPDGQKIVSASDDRTVRVWSAVSGELEQTLKGHSEAVKSAQFGPDGQKIVSASWDKTVRVWSAVTGELEQTLEGHSGLVLSAQFGPDGQKIVSASCDGTVRVWSAKTAL